MRALSVFVLLFSSLQSSASTPVTIKPPGMLITQQKDGLTNPAAVPTCKVFEMPISSDGTLGEASKLILEENVPSTQWLVIAWALPEPYSNIHLNAFYGQGSYMETGDWHSYFQASISQDLKILNWVDSNFVLADEKPGNFVLVRGFYVFSPTVALAYQCSLNF